nr:hypothetical protein [Tanacetum cinerariifolium]
FVTSMFNPSPDVGIDYLFESTPWVDVQVTTTIVPLLVTAPTLPPHIMSQVQQVPTPTPTTAPSTSLQTSYDVAADLSELELKKILIEKMESNKSIHRSDEQRNLYKALVDAYECDKIILDTYGDTVTLKRRHDDADKDEKPSVGSDRGSKRRREGKEPYIQPWISDLAKQADSRTLFNELMDTSMDFSAFLMNRLNVDTLTPELLADITSKESTLQVVYDVLRLTPFYKAFLVTADVPEIYMQELWAIVTVHHHLIRFKMNNKKRIKILAFLRYLGHGGEIKKITDVNINKLHQPWRSFAAVINKYLSGKTYKEYYAIASGAAPPKTKASIRKTQSSSDTTMPPPTATSTTLSTSAKGKQPTKSSKAKGLSVLFEVALTEAEQI